MTEASNDIEEKDLVCLLRCTAIAYFSTEVSKVGAASETLRSIIQTTGRHIPKDDNIKINGNTIYRSADKLLARATSRCILFDAENISFDASLVIRIYK